MMSFDTCSRFHLIRKDFVIACKQFDGIGIEYNMETSNTHSSHMIFVKTKLRKTKVIPFQ